MLQGDPLIHLFFWRNFRIFTCATCQWPLWLPKTRQIAPPFWSIRMIETMSKGDDGDDDYDGAVRAKEERWPGWELLLSQIQWILQLGGFLGPVLSLQFVPRGHTAPKRSYIFLSTHPLLRLFRNGNMNSKFWIRFGWGCSFWAIFLIFAKKTCVWYLFWSPSLTSSWPDKWTCQRKWFASLQTGWFSLKNQNFGNKKIRNVIVVSPFWWQAQEASCIRLQHYKDTMMHNLNTRIYQGSFVLLV